MGDSDEEADQIGEGGQKKVELPEYFLRKCEIRDDLLEKLLVLSAVAISKNKLQKDIAKHIKQGLDTDADFNELIGKGPWQVVVGRSFASAITHEAMHLCFFDLPKLQVTLMRRNLDERLGLRLCPSSRDPTRTAIEEVVPEGLAALYNKATLAAHSHDSFLAIIAPGDEVESINGVGDPNHFPECCREPQITLCLTRLSPLSTSSMHNATAQIVGNCKLAPLLQPNSTCNSSPLQHQQDHPPADATHNGHICTVTHSINQHQPEMPTESPTCSHLQQQQLLNSAKESTQQLQPSQHLPPTAQHKQQSPESSIEIDCHPQAHKSYGVPLTSDIAKLQDELSCLRDERNSLAAENVRLERAERASTAARLSAEKEVAAVRAELSTAKAELEEKLRSSQEQAQQVEQRLIDEVADLRKRLHEVASSSHHPPTGVLLQPMDTALLELQDLAASLEHLLADDAEPTS